MTDTMSILVFRVNSRNMLQAGIYVNGRQTILPAIIIDQPKRFSFEVAQRFRVLPVSLAGILLVARVAPIIASVVAAAIITTAEVAAIIATTEVAAIISTTKVAAIITTTEVAAIISATEVAVIVFLKPAVVESAAAATTVETLPETAPSAETTSAEDATEHSH